MQLPLPQPSLLPPPMPPQPLFQQACARVVVGKSTQESKQTLTHHEPRLARKARKPAESSSARSASITKEIAVHEKEVRALLAEAIKIFNFDIVSQIIRQNPALIRMLDADGRTTLGHAASLGSKEMVSHLLVLESRVAGPCDGDMPLIMLKDKRSLAPIHHALDAGNWSVVEALLKAGTPADLRTGGSHYPLLSFAVRRQKSLVDNLLHWLPAAVLNQTDDDGRTAVHHAVISDDADTLAKLLKAGCAPNLRNTEGEMPLHLAVMDKHKGSAKHLIAASPADINGVTSTGETPLHLAAKAGNEEMVRTLIEAGALVDLPDRHGWTALAIATKNGHLQISDYLLKHHANPVFGDKFWAQPLTLALARGDQNLIDIFLHRGKLTWQHVSRATRRAVSTGSLVMVKACLSSGILSIEFYPQAFLRRLLDAAINRGDPEIVGLVCAKFKRKYHSSVVDHYLGRAFHTAHAQGEFDLFLPLVQRIKRLKLDSGTLQMLLADAQARKDYALIEALTKTNIVVESVRIVEVPDNLLKDPVAREVMNQPTVPKPSLASFFRTPKVPAAPSIDAANTASQLALDLTSMDPATALGATLSAQKISGLLHQPLASSLIPMVSVFSIAGNLKLAQAQYIVGFGLAQYTDPKQLTLPEDLSQLNASENLLKKCDAHRKALAKAGEVMLNNADNRIGDDLVTALAEIIVKTPVTTTNDRESAIADKLATQFGLLPIWAKRMAKVCVAALTAATSTYQKNFNIDQPPAELLAMLTSAIVQQFADVRRSSAVPEGFAEAGLQLSPSEYPHFDTLLWRQWDRITKAMIAHAVGAGLMDREDPSTASITDKRSDSDLSTTQSTHSTED